MHDHHMRALARDRTDRLGAEAANHRMARTEPRPKRSDGRFWRGRTSSDRPLTWPGRLRTSFALMRHRILAR